ILNAMRLLRRRLEDAKIVICGAGAAGTAIARLLLRRGARDMILTDVHGIVYEGREVGMNPTLAELATQTNRERVTGQLEDALADVIPEGDLRSDYIIPDAFDFRVPPAVAAAVAKSAMETGVARIQRNPEAIARDTRAFLYEGELGSL